VGDLTPATRECHDARGPLRRALVVAAGTAQRHEGNRKGNTATETRRTLMTVEHARLHAFRIVPNVIEPPEGD